LGAKGVAVWSAPRSDRVAGRQRLPPLGILPAALLRVLDVLRASVSPEGRSATCAALPHARSGSHEGDRGQSVTAFRGVARSRRGAASQEGAERPRLTATPLRPASESEVLGRLFSTLRFPPSRPFGGP